MLKGKILYSEIYFNHQPLMAFLSYLVQKVLQPTNLYELLLFHRFCLFAFSLAMGVLIILRFRLAGVGFIIFYELTKFYLFGDRFLAESFIVYPLVYLFGLVWYQFEKRPIWGADYLLAGLFTWLVIFAREPYVPLAAFLYFLLLWNEKKRKTKLISFLIFLFLTSLTLLSFPLRDYFFNVFKVNAASVAMTETKNNLLADGGIIKSFAYPLFLFFGGKWNSFRIFLVVLDSVFLFLIWLGIKKLKKTKPIIILIFLLGLANLRVVISGTIFYEAFHMIQWYALFLITIFFLLSSLSDSRKELAYGLTALIFIALGFLMLKPGSYLWDKVDRHEELVTNYADYLSKGEVIKLLANPGDTLFLDDNRQDLVYWQADLKPAYQYSWYTYLMQGFPRYVEAREEMFRHQPPDFYYGFCPSGTTTARNFSEERAVNYVQLYFAGKKTCLYVKETKVEEISPEQWEAVKRFEYHLP